MIAKSIAVSLGSNYIHLLFSIDVSGPLAHRIGEYLTTGRCSMLGHGEICLGQTIPRHQDLTNLLLTPTKEFYYKRR